MRLQASCENDQVDGNLANHTQQRIFHLNNDPYIAIRSRVNIRDFSANQIHSPSGHAVIKLLEGLACRAHVDIEVVDFGVRFLLNEVGEF